MKWRRAGEPAAPTPNRAHRAVERSPREARPPERIAGIRGIAAVVDARRQTPEAWIETWADEMTINESEIPNDDGTHAPECL